MFEDSMALRGLLKMSESLEDAYMKRIKLGTPVKWQQEKNQNLLLLLICKELGWSGNGTRSITKGRTGEKLPVAVNHT